MGEERIELEVAGRQVVVSSPDKTYFPQVGTSKLDLVRYYLEVGDALLPHCLDRPLNLERFPNGVGQKGFVQKRVPSSRPDWLRTVEVTFGSGRTAQELCPADLAHVVWAVNLGCIAVHPWSVRLPDLSRPDELRLDLDPQPGVPWSAVRTVAGTVGEVVREAGLVPHVKTSGSRGAHVVARVEPVGYVDLRRAAVAAAREAERRRPDVVTSSWWKEERGQRVFVDYNQNLWDRTTACAYSARPVADAKVSTPLTWDELEVAEPEDLTLRTVPTRLREVGDPWAELGATGRALDGLLELADRDEAAGLPDLPLPPHYPKFPREPKRVNPSRARREGP